MLNGLMFMTFAYQEPVLLHRDAPEMTWVLVAWLLWKIVEFYELEISATVCFNVSTPKGFLRKAPALIY